MAKKEHEDILSRGVKGWNEWRQQNPGRPDLRKANITNHLIDCNLSQAWLQGASFLACDLIRANLSGAELSQVTFYSCDLSGAHFERAYLQETVFAHSILSGAKGLESCFYRRTSSCDHRTLTLSWPVPKEFMEGCDLPEHYRNWLARHFGGGPSCFLSHCSSDEDFAKGLRDDLIGHGIQCWMAQTDLPVGEALESTIEGRIRESDKVVVVISKAALSSAWVAREVNLALEEEKRREASVLVPICLDDSLRNTTVQWGYELWQRKNVADFSRDEGNPLQYVERIQRLLDSLKQELPSSNSKSITDG